jgi:hypothetical protein
MTSEVDKGDAEVISKYHSLSRIEDSFRITKSDIEGRPVYARTPEHINAHFLLCFIALTMIRIIQYKVLRHRGKESLNIDGWESGVTAERIQKALGTRNANGLSNGYYRLTKPDEDLYAGPHLSRPLRNCKKITYNYRLEWFILFIV